MLMDVGYIIAGLVLLFAGGEGLVRGAVSIATKMGISTLLVGMVVVGFGTSTPELVVSLKAALDGSPDIAFGNVVGSNIANVILIMATAALIYPVAAAGNEIRRDGIAVIVASLVLCGLSFTGQLDRIAGAAMVALLAGYVIYCYRSERKNAKADAEKREHIEEDLSAGDSMLKSVLFALGGLVLLVFGGKLLVDGAISIARGAGISEAVIGLTLVAVGTSLPELATSVVAAYRKHSDVIIGNILGSNIFNILFILGITGLIAPIPLEGQIAAQDIWVMLAVAVVTYGVIHFRKQFGRVTACAFLAAYIAYTLWLAMNA